MPLIQKRSQAERLPVAFGAKVTFAVQDLPGPMLIRLAQVPPLIAKSLALALAAGISIWPRVKAALPLLLSVTVEGLLVCPTATDPKPTEVGVTDAIGVVGAAPAPVRVVST